MEIKVPAFLRVPAFGNALAEKVSMISAAHDSPPEEITIRAIDDLISDAAFLGEIRDDLSDLQTFINKHLMRLEQKGGAYLKALGREDYESPEGSIEVGGKWAVRMPKGDEEKAALFDWLREQGLFDRYATVNSRSLNSLYMAAWKAAIKKDAEEWVLFEIPGVPSPVFDEFIKIRGKSSRKPRKGNDNDSDEE